MSPRPEPAPNCPLCGGANACGPAASGDFETDCWCRSASIPRARLDRIPEALQGKACLCRRCAGISAAPLSNDER